MKENNSETRLLYFYIQHYKFMKQQYQIEINTEQTKYENKTNQNQSSVNQSIILQIANSDLQLIISLVKGIHQITFSQLLQLLVLDFRC